MIFKNLRAIFYLSFLFIVQLFPQKTSSNLSDLSLLKYKMKSWQSSYYNELKTESAFDTIITLTASNISLKKLAQKGYFNYKNETKKLNASKNKKSLISYDVIGEMYRNSIRARNTYLKQYITIEGTVSNITKNIYGEPYVVLDPLIQCYFSDSNPMEINKISTTDYIEIKGKVEIMDWNGKIPYMQLSDCSLIKKVDYDNWESRIRNNAEDFWNTFLIKLEKEISKIDPSSSEKINYTSTNYNWIGTYKHKNGILVIKNETGNKFTFRIDVQYGNYVGSITGKATIKSNDSALYTDDCDKGGRITFEKAETTITLEESGCIVFYHGANAYFDGEYKKTTK